MRTTWLLLLSLLLVATFALKHETSPFAYSHLQDDQDDEGDQEDQQDDDQEDQDDDDQDDQEESQQSKNDTKYLAALLLEQKKIDNAIAKLEEVNNQVEDTLEQIEAVPQLKAIALAEGLADEREVVIDLENKTSLPWEYKTFDCKNFTEDEKDQLDQTITALENTLEEIGDLLDENAPEDNNTRNEELHTEYKQTETYLDEMRETVEHTCP